MKKVYLLFGLVLILSSCDISSDCGDCFTPPRDFNFEFVDAVSLENLFDSEVFDIENFKVTDEDNTDVNFNIIMFNERTIFSLRAIGWELDPKIYTIELSPEVSVIVHLDMNKNSGECCLYYEVEEFSIENYEYSELSTTGIIQVKI